jgi:hypothetical protein
MNIQATPSPYIMQGNCTRCHSIVYYFTNIPSGNSHASPSSAKLTPRRHDKSARAHRPAPVKRERQSDQISPLGNINPRLLLGSLVAVLMVLLVVILGASFNWWGSSFPAKVTDDSTLIRINNTSDVTWQNLKLTINDKYTFTPADTTKPIEIPGHSTYYIAYSRFSQANGKKFDPSHDAPKHLRIVVENNPGHPLIGELPISK